MKSLIIFLLLVSALPVHAIVINGTSYTQTRYNEKKLQLISDVRNRTIDPSTRDIVILLKMMIRECTGKRIAMNGKVTFDVLLNTFERGC